MVDGEAWVTVNGSARLVDERGNAVSGDTALRMVRDAYRKHGRYLGKYIVGQFSVEIRDLRKGEQLLVRDALGIEPLYYRHGHELRWDREVGRLADDHSKIDETYLSRALIGDFSDQTRTPYSGVCRVPPGHYAVFERGLSAMVAKWWFPPDIDETLAHADDDELASELAERFMSAVSWAAPRNENIACELSGGLDSSAITSAAALVHGAVGPRASLCARTFSGAQNVPFTLEQRFVESVVNHYDLRHRYTGHGQPEDVRPFAPRGVMPHPTRLPSFRLRHLASIPQDGFGVLLSGWGGDQLATSHGHGHIVGLLRAGKHLEARQALADRARYLGIPQTRLLRRLGSDHLKSPWVSQRSIKSLAMMADRRFARDTGLLDMRGLPVCRDPDAHRTQLLTDGHLQRRIECYAWDTSSVALNYRYPMLDRRLVEWVLKIPASRWVSEGEHRSLFRRAMNGILPDEIVVRKRKNEANPSRAQLVRETKADQVTVLRTVMDEPLVRHYLPGLSVESFQALDGPRRTHLLLVSRFLAHRTWQQSALED